MDLRHIAVIVGAAALLIYCLWKIRQDGKKEDAEQARRDEAVRKQAREERAYRNRRALSDAENQVAQKAFWDMQRRNMEARNQGMNPNIAAPYGTSPKGKRVSIDRQGSVPMDSWNPSPVVAGPWPAVPAYEAPASYHGNGGTFDGGGASADYSSPSSDSGSSSSDSGSSGSSD